MRVLTALLLLLLLAHGGAEARREGRGRRERTRGRRKANTVKRFTASCKEYTEGGEKYLDCQDRRLTAVLLGWPEDIEHLLLARNRIQALQDNTFSHFRNLRSLDLQQNEISLIEEGAFSGLSKLTTLLLQHNQLQVLTEAMLIPMPRLTYLRLHDNPWKCGCQLDSLVRFLQVPSNRYMGTYAKCVEPTGQRGQKLKTLDAKFLCSDPMEVQHILPQPPGIQKQPDATSLCHTYVFPKPLLDCKGRELKTIPTDIPASIVKMDLSFNSITQLMPKEFVAVKDLKLLNLSSNGLERIDTAAFAGLLYLRELDLSNNSLHYFNYGVLEDLYYLRMLSLGGNPWICDYNIHYLIYWLKHHPAVDYTGLVCSEPEEFRGWPVENYVKTYNAECPKDKQLGQQMGTGTTSQELIAETDEEPNLLPSPLRKKPDKFEIFRLS
ncbi:leucine-rich repeat-containing protein 17 [Astyanax mexicanus]|uniref:Leucine-rich repeat-containing protein 17 n=1 Tax=Astyanax mexicanus TaxID=7994 RepID=A0A8T2MFE4_ASTMX|nr:leucine-rich repeat-containing protein 17 [Astyanax mexicanus]XP_007245064.3 leucine-rich repeat-containing protein 17 [Astyanax mexicanus]KAG9280655.1 leucine-rich repeat-containing protein 17 [Astyanax mexicanus]